MRICLGAGSRSLVVGAVASVAMALALVPSRAWAEDAKPKAEEAKPAPAKPAEAKPADKKEEKPRHHHHLDRLKREEEARKAAEAEAAKNAQSPAPAPDAAPAPPGAPPAAADDRVVLRIQLQIDASQKSGMRDREIDDPDAGQIRCLQ